MRSAEPLSDGQCHCGAGSPHSGWTPSTELHRVIIVGVVIIITWQAGCFLALVRLALSTQQKPPQGSHRTERNEQRSTDGAGGAARRLSVSALPDSWPDVEVVALCPPSLWSLFNTSNERQELSLQTPSLGFLFPVSGARSGLSSPGRTFGIFPCKRKQMTPVTTCVQFVKACENLYRLRDEIL